MSYKPLKDLGTMAQSFHFKVTPGKNDCLAKAKASNCVCMTGLDNSTPGGCFQRADNCPDLARFCCPKGMVGRPRRYSNGYAFEYQGVVSRPEPWYPCPKDRRDQQGHPSGNHGKKTTKACNGACYDPNDFEWTGPGGWGSCELSKDARPPVW